MLYVTLTAQNCGSFTSLQIVVGLLASDDTGGAIIFDQHAGLPISQSWFNMQLQNKIYSPHILIVMHSQL